MESAPSEALFASGVLEERDGEVVLSNSFESSVTDYRTAIADDSRHALADRLRAAVDDEAPLEPLVRLGEKDPRAVAELLALRDELAATTGADRLALLPALRLFRSEPIPTDGVPAPFVPLPGELLPEFSELYSRVFAYVWLDDCDPCDALKPRLESVFERPRDVMLFAVYGPDSRETLGEQYDVTAGPAMLFLRDGRVDARLYCAHSEALIETELKKLRG